MSISSSKTIFLSFSGHDRELAREVRARLSERLLPQGMNIFFDETGIEWGGRWVQVLEQNLTSCSAYVILFGAAGDQGWVGMELGYVLQRHHQAGVPIFPLLAAGTDPNSLPPFLSQFQARLIEPTTDYAQLADTLLRAVANTSSERCPFDPDLCPFPGLKAFDEGKEHFFLGRSAETLEALQRLGRGPKDSCYRRWLLVEGPSGVGKSSLVRAGLLPAIRAGLLNSGGAFDEWHILPPVRPGTQPLENLAVALQQAFPDRSTRVIKAELTSNDDSALRLLIKELVPAKSGLVLVVDQLEELFTLTADIRERERFDRQLAQALADPDGPLHLITTIRSDFMLEFPQLTALQQGINDSIGRYYLKPIGRNGLEEIVRTPARLTCLEWSDAQLPGDIIDQADCAGRGALPLLGNLLLTLWQQKQGHCLRREQFKALGGLGGALAKRADELLAALRAEGQEEDAKRLLMALVNDGHGGRDTRRTITLAQALLTIGGKAPRALLDRLAGQPGAHDPVGTAWPRLITITEVKGGDGNGAAIAEQTLVELAHEALLATDGKGVAYWPTLHRWLGENRLNLERRALLESMALHWDRSGRPRSHLLRAHQLHELCGLPGAEAPASAYVRASRRWLWKWRFGASLLLVTTFSAVGYVDSLMRSHTYQSRPEWSTLLHIVSARMPTLFGLVPPPQELVSISPGEFLMGSPAGDELAGDNERPQHQVTIAYSFEIGRHEVTFAEYDYYAYASGAELPADEGWGRGRQPVINITSDEATSYTQWLSRQTGKTCRLPSEAEWEYAARAGTQSRYHFGDDPKRLNEYAWHSENSGGRAHPVGVKKSNSWGLYDMHGNVWEWTRDSWHESYLGAPNDGSVWDANANSRVLRSGGWEFEKTGDVRVTSRDWNLPGIRYFSVGFRVVCLPTIASSP